MKKLALFMLMLGLAVTTFAQSAPAKTDERKPAEQAPPPQSQKARPLPTSPAQVYHNQLGNLEREMVQAAEAMPAEKFDFKPDPKNGAFAESRTFKQQIGHVAANNFLFAAGLTGEKLEMTDKEREMGPASLTDKAATVKYLKDSFAAAHKALDTINSSNMLEGVDLPGDRGKMTRMAIGNILLWHGFDHYGQMALYLRMSNIVPPASRPRQ
jgi:uncharacterized damage-inducible protein DinB